MAAPITVFHVSDLHFGQEDRAALAWFAGEVARERPAMVICTGDLTMHGSARQFAMAREWLAALPVPVTLEPGNHDVPYYHHMLRRLTRPYGRFRALAAALEGPRLTGGLAVVALRTVSRAQLRFNWSKGKVGNAALDAALRDLETHGSCPLRLVACHHPLVDADTKSSGQTRGGRRALAALARAGAHAVLSGHVHDAFDLTVEADGLPIRLIGAGTLSKRLRSSPPGYNRLDWSDEGGLSVRQVRQA
jgi:3',5'-cyclic AMP phosphodiesterase CpdA